MTEKDRLLAGAEPARAEKPLSLSGGICNLTSVPLRIADASGKVRTSYPCDTVIGPASVCWKDQQGAEYRVEFNAAMVKPLYEVQVIGEFNGGYIDLVRPAVDTTPMVEFWRRMVTENGARTVGLPSMKPWRKRPGMRTYCVVSPFVALTAYFCCEELNYLLVPALPIAEEDAIYRALMPAGQLIACSSITRGF